MRFSDRGLTVVSYALTIALFAVPAGLHYLIHEYLYRYQVLIEAGFVFFWILLIALVLVQSYRNRRRARQRGFSVVSPDEKINS